MPGRWLKIGLAVIFLQLLSSCVTNSSGGLPEPGSVDQRVQAQLDLARGYLESGQSKRARRPLNKALEIDAKSVQTHVLLGVLYEMEAEYVLAEKHFKLALTYDPRNSQALNNYGSFLFARGRYAEAVSKLRLLVQDTNYRARSHAYESLGLAELKIDRVADAKDSFTRSVQLSFNQSRSYLELAQIAYSERAYQAAQENYDSFRTQARQTPRSLCLGMQLAHVSGNTDQLSSYTLALNNLYPNSPEAQNCEVGR